MKKAVIICLLAAAMSMAQRQRVAVLPSIADPETKLSARELDLLTEKLRGHASEVLPLGDFLLLKQDYVKEKLGDEALFEACKEGTCVGDLIAMVQADFGARCDVFSVNGKLWLKFELYGTLRDEDEAGTISTFSESVKDLEAMEAIIEKRVPDAFRKILLPKPPPAPPPPVQYVAPAVSEEKNDAEAYYKRGVKYFEKGDYDEAIANYKSTLRIDPNHSEQADKPKGVRFYVSPKYQLPIGTRVPWGGIALGLGLIWSSGVFFGIDGNWGGDYYGNYYTGAGAGGAGLSLGYSHDLPSHFKLAYGGSLGFWEGIFWEDIDSRTKSWSFAAPFVKLRWRLLEASYKLFLGITKEYLGENRSYYGITTHELAIGFYFGGW